MNVKEIEISHKMLTSKAILFYIKAPDESILLYTFLLTTKEIEITYSKIMQLPDKIQIENSPYCILKTTVLEYFRTQILPLLKQEGYKILTSCDILNDAIRIYSQSNLEE